MDDDPLAEVMAAHGGIAARLILAHRRDADGCCSSCDGPCRVWTLATRALHREVSGLAGIALPKPPGPLM